MDWKPYVATDPQVSSGKPCVKGTRLSIEFILDLFAKGWTREQVLENYPGLTSDSITAVFAFAAEVLHDDTFFIIKKGAA